MPASLWLAPSSGWANFAQTSVPGASGGLLSCSSLFSTKIGVAYRFSDSFAIERVDGSVTVEQLTNTNAYQNDRAASLLIGAPLYTASGMAHLTAMLASVNAGKLDTLRPSQVTESITKLAAAQGSVRNYFLSDYATLDWLSQRTGGQPLAVLTLESVYKLYKSQHPLAALEWSTVAQPSYELDFPLCTIERRTKSALEQQALGIIRGYMASDQIKDIIQASGFTPQSDPPREYFADRDGVTAALVAAWPNIRHPSSTIFVVDASIRTSRDALEAIKREIRGYVSHGLDDHNLVSIVAASTSPEVLTVASSRQGEVESALQRLTTSGGTATRDGFALAFDLFADTNSRSFRRTIVAFVSGKDTSSRTALSQFLNRGNQLVGRRNVELQVIAIGNEPKQFGDLETLVRAVGGTFVRVPLADLSSAVAQLTKQLR